MAREKYFNQPSVMTSQQRFSQVPAADIPRSKFDRSHAYKTTFDAGKLVPIYLDEVLPGDTFHMDATAFARLATPLKPVMDNMFLDIHFFFVPCRLLWDNWQKFMGERPTPDFDPNTLSIPQVTMSVEGDTSGTPPSGDRLSDYFGLPLVASTGSDLSLTVNGLPFRAYFLIWDEWYRDQNLQNSVCPQVYPNGFDNGPDTLNNGTEFNVCLPRNKRHDYFTSCLPWPQKGDAVSIPLGDTAPVVGTAVFPQTDGTLFSNGTYSGASVTASRSSGNPVNLQADGFKIDPRVPETNIDTDDLEVDLTAATAVSINDFRMAVTIQRLLERDARGGTRYIELILAHFGVRSEDYRLQRPEFLGGATTPVNLSPIASTAVTTVPQANLAAVGTAVARNATFTKSFTEHGYIIGLVSARADLTYQRGIDRMWSRETRNEFYWPTFANLGEQAVLNKEIFYSGLPVDDEVFGYQERWAEYRYKPSRITGKFNSYADDSLDVWHLAQDFGTDLPALNGSFIEENPPIDRIIAVPSEPHFLLDVWFDLKTDRPMPVYSVPGLDHI